MFFACTSNHVIEELDFETTYCEGNCPVFRIKIAKNGFATYNAISNNKISGEFESVISQEDYNELVRLLNYTNFKGLNQHYKINVTDHSSVILNIKYDGNHLKKIDDYGQKGTSELVSFYEFVFKLVNRQNWKRIKK